jgi:two-component system cell cycle response regulator CpdR
VPHQFLSKIRSCRAAAAAALMLQQGTAGCPCRRPPPPFHPIFTRLPPQRRVTKRSLSSRMRIEGATAGRLLSGLVSIVMSRIILAEDDGDMRRFLAKALEKAGYDVVSFDNGLAAYERLREEPFTLLLTDIVMPEMDGIELARRATRLDPDLKVMFITGFAAVALNSDSRAPKDAKVLSKPFHLRELVREVERLLAA